MRSSWLAAAMGVATLLAGAQQPAREDTLDGLLSAAETAMRVGKLNDSIGWLEKAAARRPDRAEIYKMLGMNYALGKMWQESAQAFNRAAVLAGDNWEYHYLHGRALYEMERLAEAQAALGRALERNPASIRAWTALGQVQEKQDDFSAAERSYREAAHSCGLAADPECAWPLMQIGFLHMRRTETAEAEKYFERAIAARPAWAKPYFYLGKSLAARGEVKAARRMFETAVRLDGSRAEYHYQLAQLSWRLNDGAAAQKYMARYRELK